MNYLHYVILSCDMAEVPKFQSFIEPQWQILKEMGTASLEQLAELVAQRMPELTEDVMSVLHKDGPRTEYEYRMAWARTYLKQAGYCDNPRKGLWINTLKGNQAESIDIEEIMDAVKEVQKRKKAAKDAAKSTSEVVVNQIEDLENDITNENDEDEWMDFLINQLMSMSPTGFEKLCRRLLMEVGFEDVIVTKQSNDGGIDGHGKLRTKDLFTQQVAFQSKRYKPGNVLGSSTIREFRGSIDGMTKMGVIITTSSFSREAIKEAARPGATTINLLNGTELCNLLKKYEIGVNTEKVESVTIVPEFFKSLD